MIKPHELAKQVYKDFDFSHPREVDLEIIANYNHIIIEKENVENCDGYIVYNRYGGIIKVNSYINDTGWERFTIAHELGHFYYWSLNNLLDTNFLISKSNSSSFYREENFANQFASNLLMPEELYLTYFADQKPTIENFKAISNEFNVSLPATAVRYATLGKEVICVVLSKGDNIKWSYRSKNFPFKISLNNKLIPEKTGPAILKNLDKANQYYYQEIMSDVWFSDNLTSRFNKNIVFLEESYILSDGTSVLTILRIKEHLI